VQHEAQLAALRHIEKLKAQGVNVDDMGRGLLKYVKTEDD